MALKQSEKTLVGVAMLAGGIALVVGLGLPQFDAYTANNTQLATLNDELKNLQIEKETLTGQIAILEKNTDIPPDIKVKTYTDNNREEIIKQMLDQVVGLATGVGNKFISLTPSEVDPILSTATAEPTKDDKKDAEPAKDATGNTEGEAAAPPPPMLNTFGYQLAVRGTYDTIQQFLKAMAQEKELLEIVTINVVNESTAKGSTSSANTLYDPSAPIKLTATIRLAMQQVSP